MKKICISLLTIALLANIAQVNAFKKVQKAGAPATAVETKKPTAPTETKKPAVQSATRLSDEVEGALNQAVDAMEAVKEAAAQAGVKPQAMKRLITAASN